MRKLKVTRSMILSFILGMSLSQLSIGMKICVAVPLIILWMMFYDDQLFHQNKNMKFRRN